MPRTNSHANEGEPDNVGRRVCQDGAAEGTRTPDPLITNEVLYQLSYRGISGGI
jgi:hypothetical protein